MPDPAKPVDIALKRAEKSLQIEFDDGTSGTLGAEYLRVYSPSAEVRGHGKQERRFPGGKSGVAIDRVEPIGHYAVRILFTDGHDSGLYTWPYLHELIKTESHKWDRYLQALSENGLSR